MSNNISPVIKIPPVDKDTRIGSIFNYIFGIIFQTEQTDMRWSGKISWDFSDCKFLHPFFIGAIAILKRQYEGMVELCNIPSPISRYFEAICLESPLVIRDKDNDDRIWERYNSKSYLPICMFRPFDSSSVKAQELIQAAIHRQLGLDRSIKEIISLLLAELIDNITEHSKSNEGFLFCQNKPSENTLYIMICDTGRSIYSSYAADSRYLHLLTNLESSGLLLALKGKSTKDRPENENRGYGISRSRKLVVEGIGGEFFILSGSCFARLDANGEKIVDLPGDIRWNGTAVLLKIPTLIPKEFNIYKFIS